MKKLYLPLAALALAGLPASAVETLVMGQLDDMPLTYISANGVWGVGTMADTYLTIYNFETGEVDARNAVDDGYEFYSPGCGGRPVSNDGKIMLAVSYNTTDPFYYWQDGQIKALPTIPGLKGGWTNGVSSNGRYIVGIGYNNFAVNPDEDSTVPVLWEWDAEAGDYSAPVVLPHPRVDLWGGSTHGSAALDVSDDGTVVSMWVSDVFNGTSVELGLARRSSPDSDDWKFEWVGADISYLPGVELPTPPTVTYPKREDYMTADEINQWGEAETLWVEAGRPEGEYPDFRDFMTPENREAYDAAIAAYNQAFTEYAMEAEAFNEVLEQALNEGKLADFELNCARMSANGQWLIATSVRDRASMVMNNTVYLFDLTTGEHRAIKPEGSAGIYGLSVADDGTTSFVDFVYYEFVQNTYVYTPATDTVLPVQDWMQELNPEIYDWMAEEMVHTFEGYNPTWVEDKYESYWDFPIEWFYDKWVTGEMVFTPDLSVVAGYALNYWNDGSDGSLVPVCYNYYMRRFYPEGGLPGITAPESASEAPVEYFDMQGRAVAAPRAGGLYLRRQGSKVEKAIVM